MRERKRELSAALPFRWICLIRDLLGRVTYFSAEKAVFLMDIIDVVLVRSKFGLGER